MNTREKIRAALLHLRYENKTADPLTITQVCKEAGIARSTFYTYYDSTDDVLQDIYESTFEKLEQIDENALASRHQLEVSTLDTLRVIRSYREAFLVLMGDYGEKLFHARSLRHIEAHLRALVKAEGKAEDELKIRFLAEGILAAILLWLEQCPELPPEDMADLLLGFVDDILQTDKTK
jgi:AcrR family transcriptional regulator